MILAWIVGIVNVAMLLYVLFGVDTDGGTRAISSVIFIPSIILAVKVLGWI